MLKFFTGYFISILDIISKYNIYKLIFTFFFPRIGILILNIKFGGFWWILGYIFYPRILIAVLVTKHYYIYSKILVFIVWYWSIKLEAMEKRFIAPIIYQTVKKIMNAKKEKKKQI